MSSYTDEIKAEAVAMFHSEGAALAAEHFGCTRQSIYNWLRESIDIEKTPEELAHETIYQATLRSSIRRRLLEKVDNLLDRFDQPHIDFKGKDARQVEWPNATSGDIRNYATSIGILIDKYRLEVGEATTRSEQVNESEIDQAIKRELAELERAQQSTDEGAGLDRSPPPGSDTT